MAGQKASWMVDRTVVQSVVNLEQTSVDMKDCHSVGVSVDLLVG